MRNVSLKTLLKLSSLSLIFPVLAHAQNSLDVTMINHFVKPISFLITTNPEMLPNLPKNFELGTNAQITTNVVDIQKKEVYLSGLDDQEDNVFFGIELINNQVKIHGYIGKNIAYSWKGNVITFCTPTEYAKKHSC